MKPRPLKIDIYRMWLSTMRRVAATDDYSPASGDLREMSRLKAMITNGMVVRLMRGHYRATPNWRELLEALRPTGTQGLDWCELKTAPEVKQPDSRFHDLGMAFRWSRAGDILQISTMDRDGWFRLRKSDVQPIAQRLGISSTECWLLLTSIATDRKNRRI